MVNNEPSVKQDWAAGLSVLAGVVLLVVGLMQFFQGVSAIAKDHIFLTVNGQDVQYIFELNLTTWGWIHLVLGVIVAFTGLGLFFGVTAARALAIAFLALSVIANFLWLPYYPWWSIIVIVLGILGIWAVSTWDPEKV